MKSHRTAIAVVSPFLDKHHGTERCVAEQIERLALDYEVHIYSHRVEEMDLSSIVWHHVPALPGPHLFAYGWWFLANQLWRWWDRQFRGFNPALVYSPGVNCFDADVISVHAVFAEARIASRQGFKHACGSPARLAKADSSQNLSPAHPLAGANGLLEAWSHHGLRLAKNSR